jgi:hydrogenase small subunit
MPSSLEQSQLAGPPAVPIQKIHALWVTTGLGCDGDTIAMTAATQPSIEDLLLGAMPWIPKVYLHNPFPTYDNGEEFMRQASRASALRPDNK